MGKLFTPTNLSSGFNTNNSLNTDLSAIEDALDKCLSRDGETPNAMNVDLDMNNNDILNAGTIDVTGIVLDGTALTGVSGLAIPDVPTLSGVADANKVIKADASGSNYELSANVPDDSVATASIEDSAVTTAKIADSNITTAKIADSNVTTAKIADSNVTTAKIADGAITAAKLALGVGTSLGHISGCTLSNNSVDALHDIDIASGECTDSTNSVIMSVSAITKAIDTVWAEGTGGGFPSGLTLTAGTWYRVFVIAKADGTVDAGFDTSSTATNLLADATGYTYYRRVGWVLTDVSSNIKEFTQYGNEFIWNVPYQAAAYTDSATSTDITVGAPPSTLWRGVFSFTVSAGSTRFFLARPTGTTDTVPSATNFTGRMEGVGTVGEEDSFKVDMPTDSSSQIAVRVSDATNMSSEAVMSFGWMDTREV